MRNYESNWGTDSKHGQVPSTEKPRDITEGYLRSSMRKCECADWIANLTTKYLQEMQQSSEFGNQIQTLDLVVFWINTLFSKIQGFVDRFNCRLDANYLLIDSVPPEFHSVHCRANEAISYYETDKIVYEGHFSTRNTTLLIRGDGGIIEAFIVPSQVWLGLSTNQLDNNDYPPFAVLMVENETIKATIADPSAPPDLQLDASSIPDLARLMFSKLIESD